MLKEALAVRWLGTTDPVQLCLFTVEETGRFLRGKGKGLFSGPMFSLLAECQDGHHKQLSLAEPHCVSGPVPGP